MKAKYHDIISHFSRKINFCLSNTVRGRRQHLTIVGFFFILYGVFMKDREDMPMRYPCLVLDHDDTVVNSTATVHYPCFVEFTGKYFPHVHYSLEEYFLLNFDPGTYALFHDVVGMTEAEMELEQEYWFNYVQQHVPKAYDGIRELLWDYVRAGGKLCVVSHSFSENILRDYRENGLPTPELVFGWDLPKEHRKPDPYPLKQIMTRFGFRPEQLLVVDDLRPGYEMAKAVGAGFAASGWANDIPQVEAFMRQNCDPYFKTVAEFRAYLLED